MKKYYKIITIGLGCLGLAFNALGDIKRQCDLSDIRSKLRAAQDEMNGQGCWIARIGTVAGTAAGQKLLAAMDNHDTLVQRGYGFDSVFVFDLNAKEMYIMEFSPTCGFVGLDEIPCQVEVSPLPNLDLIVEGNQIMLVTGERKTPITEEDFPGSKVEVSADHMTVSFINGHYRSFGLENDKWVCNTCKNPKAEL